MKKLYGLNYIRAISAIMVVLYHYTTRYCDIMYNAGYENSHRGLWWGCWAVSAFFMLSGFLTVYNIEACDGAREFMLKRISRLYPAYWAAIIITMSVTYAFGMMTVSIGAAVFNFSMLQGFFNVAAVDGAYWTLRYELQFYIMIAVILLFKRVHCIEKFTALWALVSLGINAAFSPSGDDSVIIKLLRYVVMSEQSVYFIIGISLCMLLKNLHNVYAYISIVIAVLSLTVFQHNARTLFVILVAALMFISAYSGYRFKYDRVLNYIAAISYPLYLIHQKVGYIIIKQINDRTGSYLISVFAALTAVFILAAVIHRFIEIPAGRKLRKILK